MVWCCTFLIPAPGRETEDQEFKASLSFSKLVSNINFLVPPPPTSSADVNAFLCSALHSFPNLGVSEAGPRIKSSNAPSVPSKSRSKTPTVRASTSRAAHGLAGRFPGARDRRTLRRRTARAHRGAQAQARPLRQDNFGGNSCGRRRPPCGPEVGWA